MSSTDASSEASSFASENDYLSEYDEMSGIDGLEANISEVKQIETLDDARDDPDSRLESLQNARAISNLGKRYCAGNSVFLWFKCTILL